MKLLSSWLFPSPLDQYIFLKLKSPRRRQFEFSIVFIELFISVLPGTNNVGFKLSFINSSSPPLSSTVYVPGVYRFIFRSFLKHV